MRHDLKSPLTTIISLPQLLRLADNLTDDQREMLDCIEDAGYTMRVGLTVFAVFSCLGVILSFGRGRRR